MKIGLIAMSGLQVYDKDLLAFGLKQPGLLDRAGVVASLPSLALLTLAGMTPARHEVSYLEVPDLSSLSEIPGGFDLVAISSYSAQVGEAYELADRYRARGVLVVIGGPHVTCMPEEASHHCDAVAIGQGELVWTSILEDAEKGRLKPFYGERFGRFDLRHAPVPSFELIEHSEHNRVLIETSRGCPHMCEFCAASPLYTKTFNQKPRELVLNEIDKVLSIWRRPFIEFADDNCFVDKTYWRDLLPELERRDLRWFAETDIGIGADDEMLYAMAGSGCKQVLIGLESPSSASLNGLELKRNWKKARWPIYRHAVRNIQKRGIRVTGCFVLGLDGQGPDVFDQLVEFVNELELYDVQVTVQTAFPGTALYDRLLQDHRLLEPTNWQTCTLFDVNFQPSGMSMEELRSGFYSVYERLYSEEQTAIRQAKFLNLWKRTRTSHRRALQVA